MPSTPPPGEPAPADGRLPLSALHGVGGQPFGLYFHVPFCTTRCGYCDFNTYTAAELGKAPGASRASWADTAIAELRFARRVLGDADCRAQTVFFGGGTPTLLPPNDIRRVLQAVAAEFGLASDAEVSIEANPETVTPDTLGELRAAGCTRISIGMQSVREHVLAILDRVHTPGRTAEAVADAHRAGFEHVNVDLIYGTPGETLDDWKASLESAVDCGPDHLSAYALIIEPGTKLAARIRRGELPAPNDDDQADKYLLADDVLMAAGFQWYELSNWATSHAARCKHNTLYWTGANWWGVGPGAHSHVGGTRWWNVRHPAAWAARVAAGESPAQGREVLDRATGRVERIMLETRLAGGVDVRVLDPAGRVATTELASDGLIEPAGLTVGRVVLTRRGRLLADAVVRALC
ncbi:MAG: coproporphyrinogen III oxidase [Jiangellaceae bacterium]|nr:coproporphyrinogen III oxidase [Jiangellaceae bacterium]